MKNKTRVLQLVWRLSTGGAERMVVNIQNHFDETSDVEMRTCVFTPKQNELFEEDVKHRSSVQYIPPFPGNMLPGIIGKVLKKLFYSEYRKKWLLEQVEQFKPDIIHIHLANLAAEMYKTYSSLPKSIKIIYHMHSMPETIMADRRKIIREAISKKEYYPICVTQLQRKSAVNYYGINEDATIIYNGIDETKFLNCKLSFNEICKMKKEFEIALDSFVIGTVGRGAPVKNYPLLAKAANIIAKEKKTTFFVVGEIDEMLKNTIINDAGKATVVFAGQQKDTERLYRIMDVFVLASFYESSSIVTVEAQLSSIPCVISAAISDEVIISDAVVKVSPDDNPQNWANAIQKQKGHSVILNELKRFSFDNSAEMLTMLYKEMGETDFDKM